MYKVIKYFTDLKDGNHPYNVGDDFPREGVKVDDNRIAELASSNNKRREPLIAVEETIEEKKPEKEGETNGRSGAAVNAKSKSRKKK